MFHTDLLRSDTPRPLPVEADPCIRLVARRGIYLGYLRRRVGDPATAEDLLQDFNLKVIRGARARGTLRNTDAWLSRVLRNTLFDHYRRHDARRRADAAYAVHATALSTADDMAPDAADTPSLDAQMTGIEAALARIRPDQAELLRALYLRDQPRDSLARQLNVTIGTLNVRVLRARQALRDAYGDLFATAEMTSPGAGAIADRSGSAIPGPSPSRVKNCDDSLP